MRKFALLAAAAFAATAVPASATTVLYNGNTYNPGDTINVSFTGVQDGDLHATLALLFTGTSGNDYQFQYTLTNTSNPADEASSTATAFGFNTDPNPDVGDSSATGSFTNVSSGSISGGTHVEICATGGPNCAGAANNGDMIGGGSFTGNLDIAFGSLPDTLTLTQPIVRFQSTGSNGTGSDIGTPVPGVPEPATWAMMLVGFGAAGVSMRRSRRKKTLLPQIA
jgi:hypothetical protein